MSLSAGRPALRGGLLSLLAAVLFGISTPLVQRSAPASAPSSPQRCCMEEPRSSAVCWLRASVREARLARADLSRLLAMAAFGAVIGPVALVGASSTQAASALR